MDTDNFQRWQGRIEQKLDDLAEGFGNHLKHHTKLEIGLFLLLLSLILKIILGG